MNPKILFHVDSVLTKQNGNKLSINVISKFLSIISHPKAEGCYLVSTVVL